MHRDASGVDGPPPCLWCRQRLLSGSRRYVVLQIRAEVAGGSHSIGNKRSQTHKTRRDLEAELGAVQPVAARNKCAHAVAAMPYAVSVRDRCMYSHSLKFGDAPSFRTGCTAVVDANLQGPSLTSDGVLCDILAAQKALKNVLEVLDHADLDTLPGLEGTNTTVEVVAKFIFDAFVGELKGSGAAKITRVEIRVAESDVATASYFEEDASGVL